MTLAPGAHAPLDDARREMTPGEFRALFPEFSAPSWAAWNSIEDAIFGLPPLDPDMVRRLTGRQRLPDRQVAEFWAAIGRGGGKSRRVALLALYLACGRSYRHAPGEMLYVGIGAPDRRQARLTLKYILGLLRSVPELAALIRNETQESIELSTGITIEVVTAGTVAPRGRSYVAFILEEAAFLGDEDSAEPDRELIRAIRPALARVPKSLLAVISSPYARRGELYRVCSERFGQDDPDVLVVQADTATLNPSFNAREIERAYRDDPVSAASEYGARFRDDVSGFVSAEAVAAVVPVGVRELPPDRTRRAVGHFDASTGSGDDSAAAAVAFAGQPSALAAVRQWRPPFDPAVVAREAAALFGRYGVREITIDRYAPGLVTSLFREVGIGCRPAERDTAATFLELLARVNSRQVALLDEPVLLRELSRLERRPGNGGRDSIGHPPRGHDDVIAAAAFALVAAHEPADGGWGLLFAGGEASYVNDLRRQVESLRATLGAGAKRVTEATQSAYHAAKAAVTRTTARLRPTQRSIGEIAERKAEADRLRIARRLRQQEVARAAIAARERALRETYERNAQIEQRLRSERMILRAIERNRVWWPGE